MRTVAVGVGVCAHVRTWGGSGLRNLRPLHLKLQIEFLSLMSGCLMVSLIFFMALGSMSSVLFICWLSYSEVTSQCNSLSLTLTPRQLAQGATLQSVCTPEPEADTVVGMKNVQTRLSLSSCRSRVFVFVCIFVNLRAASRQESKREKCPFGARSSLSPTGALALGAVAV